MVVFVCGCLNVKIYADAIKHQDVNQSSPLGNKVVEIELTDPGFDFQYGFLLKRESFAGWTTFTCLNCKKKTHAINREQKIILVNKELECGDDALARLVGSKEFSPVFRIVLSDRDMFGSISDPNSSFESLQSQLADVQHQMETFMLHQEGAMEERIRRFEEEQREKLSHLRAKAQEDKKKMIGLILRRAEEPSAGRAAKPRTPLTKSKSVFEGGASPRPRASAPITIGRVRSPAASMEPDLDRDELFAIDGIEGDSDSYHSSSEEEDDVPAVTMGRRDLSSKEELVYSASVPVNVPMGMWAHQPRSDHVEDFGSDEESHPLDPEQIASNMAALAESIPDNNRYIFGDRPRPRLNTNNF